MARRVLTHTYSLLHVDHVILNKKWNYQNVISPYIRIYFIDEGEGYISGNFRKVKLESGYLYIIPSFTLCNLECAEKLSQYFIHLFEDSASGISLFQHRRSPVKIKASDLTAACFKQLLKINPHRKIYRSDNPKVYEQNAFYREYQKLNNEQPLDVFMETQGILLQLLSKFLSPADRQQDHPSAIPSVILDAMQYIQINLASPITVQQLSKRANLQTDYFSRIFLKHAGERPLDYLHSKRIERAQYLMMTKHLTFAQIAEETGFQNLPYFFRIFKKITNQTPTEYCNNNHFI